MKGICGSAELKIGLIVNRQSVQGLAPHWQGALNQAMAPGGAMAGAQPTKATFRLHMFRMKNTRWPQTNHPPQHHSAARGLHQCTNSCCRGIWHASLPFSFLLNHARCSSASLCLTLSPRHAAANSLDANAAAKAQWLVKCQPPPITTTRR